MIVKTEGEWEGLAHNTEFIASWYVCETRNWIWTDELYAYFNNNVLKRSGFYRKILGVGLKVHILLFNKNKYNFVLPEGRLSFTVAGDGNILPSSVEQ